MTTWHFPNNLGFFHRPKDGLMPLFLSGVGRRVAVTLLTLFSSIYIYQIGRGLGFSQANVVIGVLAYYLLYLLVKSLVLIFSENLSQKIGFKGTIWLSTIPFILYIPSMVYAARFPYLLLFSSILFGINAGLFWWGYHGYFIKTGNIHHFGQSIGEAGFLGTVAAVLTPFLGALLISYLGFTALFISSGVIMIASFFLLGKDHDKRQKTDIRFIDVLSLIRNHKSISLAYIGSGGECMLSGVAWPLFLFLFFGKIISLGMIISLASLIAAIFALFVGGWVDRQGEKRIVAMGTPLVSISWIIKAIGKSMSSFVLADSMWNFGEKMVILPLNALTYKKAIESGSARAILFRETTMLVGGVISLLLLAIWVFFGGGLRGGFIIAAILSVLPLIAVFKKRLYDKDEKEG